MNQEDYKAAADKQGITAIVDALKAAGIRAEVEQTGGNTMAATFRFTSYPGVEQYVFAATAEGATVCGIDAWNRGGEALFWIEAQGIEGLVAAATLLTNGNVTWLRGPRCPNYLMPGMRCDSSRGHGGSCTNEEDEAGE